MFLCTNKKHNLRQVSPPPSQQDIIKYFIDSLAKQLEVTFERAEDLFFLADENVDLLLLLHAQGHNMNKSYINKYVAPKEPLQE